MYEQELLNATKKGDIKTVESLITKGANIEARDKNARTPILLATKKGHKEIIEYLLKNEANQYNEDKYGYTVLSTAIFYIGSRDFVDFLLNLGIKFRTDIHEAVYKKDYGKICTPFLRLDKDFYKVCGNVNTPFNYAAALGEIEMLESLIDNCGWRITENTRLSILKNAMALAAGNGHINAIKWLSEQGISLTAQVGIYEASLLFYAAKRGQIATVEWLLEQEVCLADKYEDKDAALFYAARNGYMNVLKVLLAAGAAANWTSYNGATPLYLAAAKGHVDAIKILLAGGALVNQAGTDDGVTPLYIATQNGHVDAIKSLLAGGAAINQGSKNGITPLYIATLKGHVDTIKLLLAAGAAVNQGSKNGTTPLYNAASKGHLDAIKILLAGGAAVNQGSKNGTTPLRCAAYGGQLEATRLLILRGGQWGKNGKPPFLSQEMQKAIKEGKATKKAAFNSLLAQIKNFEITSFDIAGDWLTSKELQQLILAVKNNLNIKTCFLGEQLDKASFEDQLYIQARFTALAKAKEVAIQGDIATLLQLTADKQPISEALGYSALHVAAIVGNSKVIESLIDKKIAVELKDKEGKTALHLAKEYKQHEFAQRLKFQSEERHLKQLIVEAGITRQAIQDAQTRQKQLRSDLNQLIVATDLKHALFIQQTWITIYELKGLWREFKDYLDLSELTFPSLLLRHEGFSTLEKMKVSLKGKITLEHPMFKEINQRIKKLREVQKQLAHSSCNQALERLINIYETYREKICNATEEQRKVLYQLPVLIAGADLPASFLDEAAGKTLTPEPGRAKENIYGTSQVYPVGNIHFKLNPHAPGVEFMVSSLGRILAGQGATPTELLKVFGSDGIPRVYQASKTVKGKELLYVLDKHPEYLAKLRPANFSAMVILGLLTDPADGKSDNYMVEFEVNEDNQIEWLEILGIDNDIAFADDAVIVREDKGVIKHQVNIRNALYFFSQMEQQIDASFKEMFLKRIPELVLIEWLQALHKKNQEYQSLLKQGVFTQEEFKGDGITNKHGLQLPIKLAPSSKTNVGTVARLYHKLKRIRKTLSETSNLTHWQLFELLEPAIAKVYSEIKTKVGNDPEQCMKMLYEESIDEWEDLKRFKQEIEKKEVEELSKIMTGIALKTATNHGFEAERTQTIEQSTIDFLRAINYTEFKGQVAKVLFNGIQNLADLYPKKNFLYVAAEYNLIDFAKWLLEERLVNVDITNKSGYTALHIAASCGHLPMLKFLLSHGADIHKRDNQGRSGLDKARSRNQHDVIEWLERCLSLSSSSSTPTSTGALLQLPQTNAPIAWAVVRPNESLKATAKLSVSRNSSNSSNEDISISKRLSGFKEKDEHSIQQTGFKMQFDNT